MGTGNKNAYEIRLELLQLAYNIAKDEINSKAEVINVDGVAVLKPSTSADAARIIGIAKTLNVFVSSGGNQ